MQEQDFLIKKYEYSSIYNSTLQEEIREENLKYEEVSQRIKKKDNDFERVRNIFLERKNLDEKNEQNNLKFLQKRIVEKSNDIEKNKKVLNKIKEKNTELLNKLNKSNKELELIYNKIQDIKLNKKIKKENIETSENIETYILNKKFKSLLEKNGKREIKDNELKDNIEKNSEKLVINDDRNPNEKFTNLANIGDNLDSNNCNFLSSHIYFHSLRYLFITSPIKHCLLF